MLVGIEMRMGFDDTVRHWLVDEMTYTKLGRDNEMPLSPSESGVAVVVNGAGQGGIHSILTLLAKQMAIQPP